MAAGLPAAVITVLALLAGASLAACADAEARGGAPAGTEASGGALAAGSFRSTRTYPAVAPPVRLRIPGAHIDTALGRLGRAADGTINVPSRPGVAGWYAEGPRPGQPGPAVIVGHVDSASGPAVFYHLSKLRRDDPVYVHRADGSTIAFRVTGMSQVPKTRFPTDLVYGPTLAASLRLVTCGGSIDPTTRHYRDNVIVFAAPA